jgi:hypothetical protein
VSPFKHVFAVERGGGTCCHIHCREKIGCSTDGFTIIVTLLLEVLYCQFFNMFQ